jgi:hypothetical protein
VASHERVSPRGDGIQARVGNPMLTPIDEVMSTCLTQLAADPHVRGWSAKERNWVNYFAHGFLLQQCRPDGVFRHPTQIAIEVGVPQPPGYTKPTTHRDLVIWSEPGSTCWSPTWAPVCHPLAIVEWKVHRPGRRNVEVLKERAWLRAYCAWVPATVAYAIEVEWSPETFTVTCSRFQGTTEVADWLLLRAPHGA